MEEKTETRQVEIKRRVYARIHGTIKQRLWIVMATSRAKRKEKKKNKT
jgi:hypothetical protein